MTDRPPSERHIYATNKVKFGGSGSEDGAQFKFCFNGAVYFMVETFMRGDRRVTNVLRT